MIIYSFCFQFTLLGRPVIAYILAHKPTLVLADSFTGLNEQLKISNLHAYAAGNIRNPALSAKRNIFLK